MDEAELSRIIVGGAGSLPVIKRDRGSETVFELRDVSLEKSGIHKPLLDGISMKVKKARLSE